MNSGKILVVEDNPLFADMITANLDKNGCGVTVAIQPMDR